MCEVSSLFLAVLPGRDVVASSGVPLFTPLARAAVLLLAAALAVVVVALAAALAFLLALVLAFAWPGLAAFFGQTR